MNPSPVKCALSLVVFSCTTKLKPTRQFLRTEPDLMTALSQTMQFSSDTLKIKIIQLVSLRINFKSRCNSQFFNRHIIHDVTVTDLCFRVYKTIRSKHAWLDRRFLGDCCVFSHGHSFRHLRRFHRCIWWYQRRLSTQGIPHTENFLVGNTKSEDCVHSNADWFSGCDVRKAPDKFSVVGLF